MPGLRSAPISVVAVRNQSHTTDKPAILSSRLGKLPPFTLRIADCGLNLPLSPSSLFALSPVSPAGKLLVDMMRLRGKIGGVN